MSEWQCGRCGIVEELDITVHFGIQDCECGGYMGEGEIVLMTMKGEGK